MKNWYEVRKLLGKSVFKTESDCGGVKVGTENCMFIVPNGYGDGESRVAIIDESFFDNFENGENPFKFFTSVEGDRINIFWFDTSSGEAIARTLSGRYGVYFWGTFVVFEKWN